MRVRHCGVYRVPAASLGGAGLASRTLTISGGKSTRIHAGTCTNTSPNRYLEAASGTCETPAAEDSAQRFGIARDMCGWGREGQAGSTADLPAEVDPGEAWAVVGVERARLLAPSPSWTRADRR